MSTTTTSLMPTTTTTIPSIFTTVKLLSGFVWLNAERKDDYLFYYNNDNSDIVNDQQLFMDETYKYLDGKCAAILPNANDVSKFYLQAVRCDAKAKAVCKASVTVSVLPGENLPKMPCVQISSRKKRSAEENKCSESDEEGCVQGVSVENDRETVDIKIMHLNCKF